jgi:transposase InsO family protein
LARFSEGAQSRTEHEPARQLPRQCYGGELFPAIKTAACSSSNLRHRDEARQDIFDYIEMFYNPKRRHSFSNDMSPAEYENQYFKRLSSV